MTDANQDRFLAAHARLIERLQAKALGALPVLQAHFPAQKFAAVLFHSVCSRFSDAVPSDPQVSEYLNSVHVEDLALACACSEGHEPAWEHFIRSYRPQLYAAARAIARESAARELADSLYAELYGVVEKEGRRRSLFDYYHGRSKLSTWLRAVLAQRYVDAIRATRREESLDAPDSGAGEPARRLAEPAVTPVEPDPDRPRFLVLLQKALADAIRALDPRDRLRLACYYVQDLTLAQTGRLLGEHEATVSRKLDRTRRGLRKQVDRTLRRAQRLSEAQIRLCYQYAMEEWPFDLTAALAEKGSRTGVHSRAGSEKI